VISHSVEQTSSPSPSQSPRMRVQLAQAPRFVQWAQAMVPLALCLTLVVGVGSTGRGRGSGSDDAPRRWWLLPVPVSWRNQVTKSCAAPDRGGGGASRRGGVGMGGACALTDRAANNRNDRENVPALNTLDHTVIPPRCANSLPLSAIDGSSAQ